MAARTGGRSSLELAFRLVASVVLWVLAAGGILHGLSTGILSDVVIGVLLGVGARKVARPRPRRSRDRAAVTIHRISADLVAVCGQAGGDLASSWSSVTCPACLTLAPKEIP